MMCTIEINHKTDTLAKDNSFTTLKESIIQRIENVSEIEDIFQKAIFCKITGCAKQITKKGNLKIH